MWRLQRRTSFKPNVFTHSKNRKSHEFFLIYYKKYIYASETLVVASFLPFSHRKKKSIFRFSRKSTKTRIFTTTTRDRKPPQYSRVPTFTRDSIFTKPVVTPDSALKGRWVLAGEAKRTATTTTVVPKYTLKRPYHSFSIVTPAVKQKSLGTPQA